MVALFEFMVPFDVDYSLFGSRGFGHQCNVAIPWFFRFHFYVYESRAIVVLHLPW